MKFSLKIAIVCTVFLAVGVAIFAFLPPRLNPPGLNPSGVGPHILGFAALTVPIILVEPGHTKAVVVAAFVYGCCFEAVQPAFGRAFEWIDILLNAAGIAVGLALGRAGNKIMRRF